MKNDVILYLWLTEIKNQFMRSNYLLRALKHEVISQRYVQDFGKVNSDLVPARIVQGSGEIRDQNTNKSETVNTGRIILIFQRS